MPSFAVSGDAGMDLCAAEDVTLAPGERASCGTGIAVKIPDGYVGLVWDKSGVSHRNGIKTLGGVMDSGYTGEYKIGLVNLSDQPYGIAKGQKIAQLLIQKVETPEIVEAEELPQTSRGAQGFGSTGA